MILALVLLPALAGVLGGNANQANTDGSGPFTFFEPHTIWGALGLALAKLAAFFAIMVVVGRRVIPPILHYVAHTGWRLLSVSLLEHQNFSASRSLLGLFSPE